MKNLKFLFFVGLLTLIFVPASASAQMSRKPSPSRDRVVASPTPRPPSSAGAAASSSKRTSARSLPAVKTQGEFDSIARVVHPNTPYALPHAMFVIDRRSKNRIYYVNSQKYRFHKDFLIANYMVLKGENFFEDTYIKENRRFIVGTIAWQTPVKKFTFEFWEGDMVPADQIKLAHDVINRTFFEPVAFKPNSTRQDDLSSNLGVPRVTADEIQQNQEYLALNTARGIGRLHIIEKLDDTVEIGYNEILVLKEVPQNLPPVAGIILTQPTTPLTHINILAKGWGIPNAYIKDADKLFKEYDTWWVEFETLLTKYNMRRADKKIIDEWDQTQKELGRIFKSPPSDLKVTELAALRQMRRKDSIAYGAKAANLGELANTRIAGAEVPNGFSVPFYYYDKFMRENGFADEIDHLLDDLDFVHNPRFRRQKLTELRAKIQNGKFDEKLKAEILRKWRTDLGGKGVFIRSSSNAEDLPNFSGAGLYSSVSNVKEADKVIEGVKTVWASLWNFDAHEARERNFINHRGVYMSAFIQVGVNMDNGGVLITKDPFDPENKNAVYISAVWGHNLQITNPTEAVNNSAADKPKKTVVPEQLLFTPKSNAIQILTRSTLESVVTFDENGGLKDAPVSTERRVLTDRAVRSLVRIANNIKRIFGGREQDIEWGIMNGQVYILQARPYVEKKL